MQTGSSRPRRDGDRGGSSTLPAVCGHIPATDGGNGAGALRAVPPSKGTGSHGRNGGTASLVRGVRAASRQTCYNRGAMSGFLIRWAINALALYLTTLIVKGVTVPDATTVIIAALVLGIVNAVIRPIVLLLTLPFNLLTLGLFTLVVNAGMLYLVSAVTRLRLANFWSAFLGALVLSVISFILSRVVTE